MEQFSARQYFAKLKIGDLFFKRLINSVRAGDNTVMQNNAVEAMISDDKWLKEIETYIFNVEQIVRSPKKSIKDEAIVVQIEKAKKISSQSIRHLSSHSNFVRAVDDDGTVHPSKIMTNVMDEDLLIYENRFIYTLILRLLSFLEQKHRYLSQFSEKFQITRVNYKSEFAFSDLSVEYDLKMKVKKPLKEKAVQDLGDVMQKLEMLKKRVNMLLGSDFYKKLSKTNPLKPPISKTNIIKMNVNYNNCYKLWLFISSFVSTGYSVTVSEINFPVEQEYYDDLVYLTAISLKTLIENSALNDLSEIDDYEEQISKDYVVEQRVNFIPDYNGFKLKEVTDTDYLNEYYYTKIKEILKVGDEKKHTEEIKKDLSYSFTGFYKQLSNVNNTLFNELITFDYDPEKYKDMDEKIKLQEELKYQKEIYRRNHLLAQLKKVDLQNTQRKEAAILSKIKKLEQLINSGLKENKEKLIKSVAKKDKSRKEIIKDIEKNDKKIEKKLLKENTTTNTIKDNNKK